MSSITMALGETDEEILSCRSVMRELRPQWDTPELLARIRVQQREGRSPATADPA